jgi:diaminopropionate ammonia-lyase
VLAFHRTLPGYRPTPLVRLTGLAGHLGVADVRIKDESGRFGLNAFKALGASYAMARTLAARIGYAAEGMRWEMLRHRTHRDTLSQLTWITATEGNHGRAVAWFAGLLGCRAVVLMPAGASSRRIQSVRRLGAEVVVCKGNYDNAVRQARQTAASRNWLLVQDTARTAGEDIPLAVMQGYLTMLQETFFQAKTFRPTHVFLQCGVGSLAAACQAYLVEKFGTRRPRVVVVEPLQAACYYLSIERGNGHTHRATGTLETVMAGLACGEANCLAWPILREFAAAFAACSDTVAMDGMDLLAHPQAGDAALVSGESGAVTAGLLRYLMQAEAAVDLRHRLGLNRHAAVLLLSTEGATDPVRYRRIVGVAPQNVHRLGRSSEFPSADRNANS